MLLELTTLITVHRLKKTLNLISIKSGQLLNTGGGGEEAFLNLQVKLLSTLQKTTNP